MIITDFVAETRPIAQKAIRAYFSPGRYKVKPAEQATLECGSNSRIPFGGGELAVTTWGIGTAVLLVHGWGGSRAQMSGFVKSLLAVGFRVVAFDQPAHGELTGELTNLFEIAPAMNLITEREGNFHTIAAHSFGTLVISYVLVKGNFPPPVRMVYLGVHNRLSDTLPRFQVIANLPDNIIKVLRDFIEDQFGKDALLSISNESLTSQINISTLLFHDQNDKVTPVEESRAIVRAWKSAQLIGTDGLGHRCILQSGMVYEQAVKFLKN